MAHPVTMYTTFAVCSSNEDEDASLCNLIEEDEENFVLTSLLTAVEEGNLPGVKELLETAENFDVNSSNKHGETALHLAAGGGHLDIIEYLSSKGIDLHVSDKHGDSVTYWAARQGHVHVILYLKDQGVSLNAQNKAGEAPIHVAARYGHINVIEFLCKAEEADVNLQDKLGETALHNAAWHGLPSLICLQLCSAGCHLDKPNKEGETPLHCASARGNVDCVRVLIKTGASLNVPDKRGSTALHLACRRHHVNIAVLLLHSGCQFDVVDQQFETPLHIAAREGLLPVVQTLCAFGCRLDASNKIGLTPMHLASRGGFAEVVRCLLLSGAEPDLPNKDGVTAEIMALAQGHSDVAELLTRLKPERREVFMRQLIPTNTMLGRIKLKIFGNSGVGKTTLVDSLKCGYFGSFFRKARLSSSNSVGHNMENGTSSPKHHSLPSQLSYEVVNGGYTKGIDVQQINISGCGDLSVWDFGGYEPYFMTYDHFIGDPNCIHMVVFSLTEPESIQLAQITFWLDFLKSRIPPFEPVSQQGKSPWPAKVILVGTHADKAPNIIKKPSGEYECSDVAVILTAVQEKYQYDFDISKQIFVADAHLAMSPDLKSLRMHLGDVKAAVVKSLPTSNGFLDAVVQTLPAWRKTTANFPVLPWPNFIEFVRSRINTLASEDHMKELMHQLQLLGEVVYLETEQANDLVILCPRWLCTDIIGQLLSHERIMHCRPTGCFTVDDFQLMFPETEAADLLKVLEALEICTECMIDGDPEYEFPCLNFVETLHGLWEKDVKRYPNAVYGGVRLNCPHGMTNQLVHMFPRIQVQLRRNILADQHNPDTDLYQWYQGSKYCIGSMEALLTIEQSDQVVEIKVRGPQDMRTNLYYFFEEMVEIVEQFLDECCPGFQLEKHLLSPSHLKQHCKTVHSYAPKTLLQMQLEGRDALQLDEDVEEDFIDVACFGSQEIRDGMTPGTDLHISNLNIHTRRLLSQRLDPPDAMGRDWCLLAVSLGLTDNLPKLEDSKRKCESATDRTLEEWSHDTSASIAVLIAKLEELGRNDVVDCILNSGPLWRVYHEDPSQDSGVITAPSHSSNNTLSSVS